MAKRLSEDPEQLTQTDLQPENTDIETQDAGKKEDEPTALETQTAIEAEAPVTENKSKDEKPKSKAAKKEVAESEIPENITKILKGYPQYEILYVDAKGGIFSPNTPEKIRGNAVAYSNPHFTK